MVGVECLVYREKTNNVFRYSSKTINYIYTYLLPKQYNRASNDINLAVAVV